MESEEEWRVERSEERSGEWRERSTDTSDKQNVGNVTMYCVDQRLK